MKLESIPGLQSKFCMHFLSLMYIAYGKCIVIGNNLVTYGSVMSQISYLNMLYCTVVQASTGPALFRDH
jgi:hypothetical protein